MADIYVRSTDGNNADDGSTWALAKADLHTPVWAAGDRIFVSQAHAQSSAAAVTIALAGTNSNPTHVLCVSDSAEPPTTETTGATITTTGSTGITVTGSARIQGIRFNAGTTGSQNIILTSGTATNETQEYKNCVFDLVATGASGVIRIGISSATTGRQVLWDSCSIKLSASTHKIEVNIAKFSWVGGSIQSGSSTPTSGLFLLVRGQRIFVYGVDFSNFASTLALVQAGSYGGTAVFVNCKMPASWSGGLVAGAPTNSGFRAELYNCDSTDTNYRLWVEDYTGAITDETTLVRTGGATDGTTPISWKMATTANANELVAPLISPEMAVWNETTAASKTVTVEILHDSVTNLTDAEVWLEVSYLGTSGVPLGSTASDHRATSLTTAADQTTSTVAWTTTGMTNPNKQKLSVTFTPQEKGLFVARVVLAKPSKIVFVDNAPVVT